MKKDEFFETVKEKISLTKDEFEEKFKAAEEECKERGVSKKDLEATALKMVRAQLKKQLISPAKKFTGYIIGINPNGALNRNVDKVKEDSILEYRNGEEKAVENRFVDANGNPMWHVMEGINVADWKVGSLITDDDYTETVIMLAKREEDDKYKRTELTLRGQKRDMTKPRCVEVEFLANLKSHEGKYVLNQSINTEFKVIGKEEIDFPKFAKKYLNRHCIDIQNLETWHDKHEEDFSRLAITRSSVINIVPSIDEAKSHLFNLDVGDNALDEESITCWMDYREEINFNESTPEIYVIGSSSKKIDDDGDVKISMNIYGVYVPKEWRVEKPKEIPEPEKEVDDSEPEPTKEEVDAQIKEQETHEKDSSKEEKPEKAKKDEKKEDKEEESEEKEDKSW